MMSLVKECSGRLKAERERLGYTTEQVAALGGVEHSAYLKMEAGDLAIPFDFNKSLGMLGFRPMFVGLGDDASRPSADEVSPASILADSWLIPSDGFVASVRLMRRSAAALDAFLGQGTAQRSPELIAALMQATLRYDLGSSPGEREELHQGISDGLDAIAGAVQDILPMLATEQD